MGCKLLEIMADGLYSVFHRFEAFLKKGLTHKHRLLDVLLQSLLFLLQPLKQALAGLPAPSSRGRLCCHAGLTAPSFSHRWPSHPSTHPHLLLLSGDGRRTSKPSHSPPRGKQLPSFHWLRVVPLLGLAVVHRPSALGAAWSTWSTNDMHGKWTVRGEADSWVHGRRQGNASLLRAK